MALLHFFPVIAAVVVAAAKFDDGGGRKPGRCIPPAVLATCRPCRC